MELRIVRNSGQTLEKITELYQIYPCKEGRKLEHQTKNRNPDIFPGDHWCPILLSALTRHGAPGYINAVFVNSNSQEDAMIVTQLPMKHTLADFWALVWDYKCTAVVMMQRAQDLQEALEKITELYQIYPCKEGRKLEHQTKNRNPDIFPGDHWCPILLSALTRHGAPGYINAVFVNSISQEDAMIVTQLPMKHTLADFWALVWDYKCTAVVMMQRAQDLQENGARFWPEKGETCYGAFKVKTMAKNQGHGYTALTLNLRRSKGSDSSLEVRIFQLESWPLDRSLPENPAVLIGLIGEVPTADIRQSHLGHLIRDGAGRAGLFCAGVITCDQIRSEGCLDVSQTVWSLRRRRCQFIPTVEQYSFCYTLAQSYLDSFEKYGNFK